MSEKFTLTKHNGRSGQNGVYNPKHNDRSFNISGSEHIDPERMKKNIYWDWIRGYSGWEDHNPDEDVLDLRFENVEKQFYNYQYDDFCEAQHERNRKAGHSKRNRSPDDLRLSKKNCPEESLIQIGSMEYHVEPEILLRIAQEYFKEYEKRFAEKEMYKEPIRASVREKLMKVQEEADVYNAQRKSVVRSVKKRENASEREYL